MSVQWLHLNWIDYVIIAIVLVSLLIGLVRGFVCEIISLISWVAAFVLAFKFAGALAGHLTFAESPGVRYAVAFAIIFIVTLIIGITINALVRHLWHHAGVPPMDRTLGTLLGIVRGVLIVAFLILLLKSSPLKDEDKVKESQFIPLFNPVVNWLHGLLPEKVTNVSEWTTKEKKPANTGT